MGCQRSPNSQRIDAARRIAIKMLSNILKLLSRKERSKEQLIHV
jgi:hypothetical protein